MKNAQIRLNNGVWKAIALSLFICGGFCCGKSEDNSVTTEVKEIKSQKITSSVGQQLEDGTYFQTQTTETIYTDGTVETAKTEVYVDKTKSQTYDVCQDSAMADPEAGMEWGQEEGQLCRMKGA